MHFCAQETDEVSPSVTFVIERINCILLQAAVYQTHTTGCLLLPWDAPPAQRCLPGYWAAVGRVMVLKGSSCRAELRTLRHLALVLHRLSAASRIRSACEGFVLREVQGSRFPVLN